MNGIFQYVIDSIVISLTYSGSNSEAALLEAKIRTEEILHPPGNQQINIFRTDTSHVGVQPIVNPRNARPSSPCPRTRQSLTLAASPHGFITRKTTSDILTAVITSDLM